MAANESKAQRYLQRAEGLRKIAEDLPAGNTQRMILGIAREYDRLAREFEQRESQYQDTSAAAALTKLDNPD
jgi:hypothetical protein